MHRNFRQPFGFHPGPGPSEGPDRGHFQGPQFGNRFWHAPPNGPRCGSPALLGPPQSRFGQPWGNCPPNFDSSRFSRPPFNPTRGGHDFRGRGGYCDQGRGRGYDGGGRGGFDGQGRGRGGDNFRGGEFRGRGGFGGRGGFPPRGRGGQFSTPHVGFNTTNKKAKKVKVDKRDLPENNVFRCDSCDRGFKTKDVFDQHVREHQQCHYKGCEYIAAPKLVKIHIQCQHIETNVAAQVWKSMSPEEIAQWRAERRKNFPTKDNMARKEKEMQEKAARGELIETRQFGRMRGRGNYRARGGNPGGRGRGRGGHSMQQLKRPAREDWDVEEPGAKRPAPGVSQELSHEKKTADARSEALARLASAYDGGDTGDDEDAPEELDIGREVPDAPNGDIQEAEEELKNNKKTKKKRGRDDAINWSKFSLLEKLLANDIRHERNVILQCAYYVVENNFFQPHQNGSGKEVRDACASSAEESQALDVNGDPSNP